MRNIGREYIKQLNFKYIKFLLRKKNIEKLKEKLALR